MKSSKQFIFTITPGRTGTAYLSGLLKNNLSNAEIYHEILGYDKFGVDTPDVSHLTLFNSRGNVEKVKNFWRQKFDKICKSEASYYVETSHILIKAGLAENLQNLWHYGNIHFIILKRDIFKTVLSYRNRFDFYNKGNMWMWYLDPDYPHIILYPEPFLKIGINGIYLWYICEMRTRAEYYKILFKDNKQVIFHDINIEDISDKKNVSAFIMDLGETIPFDKIIIPPLMNTGKKVIHFPEAELNHLKTVINDLDFDPKTLAEIFIRDGGLL